MPVPSLRDITVDVTKKFPKFAVIGSWKINPREFGGAFAFMTNHRALGNGVFIYRLIDDQPQTFAVLISKEAYRKGKQLVEFIRDHYKVKTVEVYYYPDQLKFEVYMSE